jgi:broad specificity phosphatase PhoE
MVHIKIIRHSERLDYAYPWYWIFCIGQYWTDPPLTLNGHLMAKRKGCELKKEFDPKIIYTSPYTRTFSTAIEINYSFPEAKIVLQPLLSEFQYFKNHSTSFYPLGIPATFNGKETKFNFPENYEDFEERIIYCINKLIKNAESDILIVTHAEAIKVFAGYLKSIYTDITLEFKNIGYLDTLSFDYVDNQIIKNSIY